MQFPKTGTGVGYKTGDAFPYGYVDDNCTLAMIPEAAI